MVREASTANSFDVTPRQFVGEFVGTLLLLAVVVGSGQMAAATSQGQIGLALTLHAISIGAVLTTLVIAFGAVSGAHFNPAVSFAFWMRGELPSGRLVAYVTAQVLGALVGVLIAHLMFDLDPLQLGSQARTGPAQWLSEVVSTFLLVFVIFGAVRNAPSAVPFAVGLVVMGGILFTGSTFFANPAVSIARATTDTFTGINPAHVPLFVISQIAGAALAVWFAGWLYGEASAD